MDLDRGIGLENRLPWHLPADLQHFKKITMGKPIVMGRKTFDSIGKPLPGRRNVVITKNREWKCAGVEVVYSVDEMVNLLRDEKEVMIIGGASFYQQLLSKVARLYLTIVQDTFKVDAYFPEYDCSQWKEIAREHFNADAKNKYDYDFITLEKV